MICYSSSEYQTLPPHTSNNNSKIILFASTLCQRHSIVTTKNSICQSFSTTTLQYNSHSTSNTSRSRLTITFHSFITEKCHQELIHCQSSDLLLVSESLVMCFRGGVEADWEIWASVRTLHTEAHSIVESPGLWYQHLWEWESVCSGRLTPVWETVPA